MSSGETTMYKVKPFFELDQIHINCPMYAMKNIQTDLVETANTKMPSDSVLNEVEERQDVLLKLIGEIKELLAVLRGDRPEPKIASANMLVESPEFSKFGVIHEVVLNASVKNPPNSLLALDKLWNNVNFIFSWHCHSSLKGLPKNLKKFETIKSNENDTSKPQLRIRVVWKEVWSDTELIISPFNSVPLLGEVNFLRFLRSSLNKEVNSDQFSLSYVDSKLDACHCLSYCENIQQSQEYYNILSDGLEKNKWLIGEDFSIADVACWSALSNLKNPSLNPLLTRWLKDCEKCINK